MSKVTELPSNGGGTVTHVRLRPDSDDLEGKEDGGRAGEGEEEERRKPRKNT